MTYFSCRPKMGLAVVLIMVLALCVAIVSSSNPEDTLRPLPYPHPPVPSGSVVFAYDTERYSSDDVLLLLTLQGQFARLNNRAANASTPGSLPPPVLLFHVPGANVSSPELVYWASYRQRLHSVGFVEVFQWTAEQLFRTLAPGYITGAYLTALHTDSVNIGVSLCGLTDGAVVITDSHLLLMAELNITVLEDVRNMTETDFVNRYLAPAPASQHRHDRGGAVSRPVQSWPFSTRFVSCQLPDKAVTSLSDWTIMLGAIQIQQTENYQRVLSVLHTSHPGHLFNAVFGWVTVDSGEHDFTGNASAAGAGVLASDWLNNGATHAMLSGGWRGNLVNPTKADPLHLPDNTNKHTAAFLFTDGDNICSDLNLLLDTRHWAHPKRGSLPVGWGINPTLGLTAPVGTAEYYRQAVPAMDGFVAFSAQYAFPEAMPDGSVQQWAELSAQAMAASDLHVVNFIGNNFTEASFAPLLQQWNIDGCIYFEYYGNYVLETPRNGSVQWVAGKPCIAVRESLWAGHSTEKSIAALLNSQSRDQTTEAGYSVIAVHIWSEDIDNLLAVQALLQDDVLLVKPDELVQLMTQHVQHST